MRGVISLGAFRWIRTWASVCVSMYVWVATAPLMHAQTPSSISAQTGSLALLWPIKTREHIDLWLHGFALLQDDSSSAIPLFRRGYRDELTVLKNSTNVLTQLDLNVERLQDGLHKSRMLASAQFLPFYFSSLDEMRAAIQQFVAGDGSPKEAPSRAESAAFEALRRYFQTPADRAWLALFSSGLWDEESKFYHSYWVHQQRSRGKVIDSVQAMWQHTMLPRLQRFLNSTQQHGADIMLCLPLDGEGRTLSGAGVERAVVGVTFPASPSDAAEAMYAIVHEIVGRMAHSAIRDNVTAAQVRSGDADRLESPVTVRAGLMLLQKKLPELADGYASYYIQATGRTPDAHPQAQMEALFPLPDAMRASLAHQMDVIENGV
jgi:hypothetical protein